VVDRMRCAARSKQLAPVNLCTGHREHSGGASADWAIELVPRRRGVRVGRARGVPACACTISGPTPDATVESPII
jgi:hypothetical protein